MVYDATRKNVLLFGGDRATDRTLLGDTWTWGWHSLNRTPPEQEPVPQDAHCNGV